MSLFRDLDTLLSGAWESPGPGLVSCSSKAREEKASLHWVRIKELVNKSCFLLNNPLLESGILGANSFPPKEFLELPRQPGSQHFFQPEDPLFGESPSDLLTTSVLLSG